jgi:hypothetical protein
MRSREDRQAGSPRALARPRVVLAFTLGLALAALVAAGAAGAATTSTGSTSATTPAPPTPAPRAPSVSTSATTNVTYSSATLYGYVNAEGQETTYHFQYGTSAAYGATTPLSPAGNGTSSIKVSQPISGLQPGTVYHYRVVATNAKGTTDGSDRAFKTAQIPLSLQIAGVPNPVPFGEPFLVEGSLTGTGSANHAIVLQANPFPYTAGFKTVGNAELTNSTGGFSFPVVGLLENTQLRVQTVGAPTVTSPVLPENVAIRVTFQARRTHRRHHWRLYGTVTPAEPGALVGFQLLVAGGRTVNEGGTVVKQGSSTVSTFSRTVHLHHGGVYRALVKINDGAHVSAYSAPVLIP